MRYNKRMNRYVRVLAAALGLLLVVVGTTLANRPGPSDNPRPEVAASHQPQQDDGDEDGPQPANVPDKVVERLQDAEIADADAVAELAATYGIGGAVRLLAWADATGMSVADLEALLGPSDGKGDGWAWGQVARQLNEENPDLHLTPGVGQIMGQGQGQGQGSEHGLGRESAPGQNKP